MEHRFNLIDEDWIPIEGQGRVSLHRVFSDSDLHSLGGNAVQKLSILKLLLAIAQTAVTPENDEQWARLGKNGLAQICLQYLERHHDLFYLYGDKPFLQMPVLKTLVDTKKGGPLKRSPIGKNYIADLSSENDTILFESQISHPVSDAEKTVFIISLMNYSLGGKRVSGNRPPLTAGYSEKLISARSSPSIGGSVGFLNSCLWGESILETIWMNVLTREALRDFRPDWMDEEIIPPWEQMPTGEDDAVAKRLKTGFMGTLIAMSRFVLLDGENIIYAEGLRYPSNINGWREPFLSFNSKNHMIMLNTERRPWRSLTALLTAIYAKSDALYTCPQITMCLTRAREYCSLIGIFSGGLQVRGNAGDQSVKQKDDYIESVVFLDGKAIGAAWFLALSNEMKELEALSSKLSCSVKEYYQELGCKQNQKNKKSKLKKIINIALTEFWVLVEPLFQEMVIDCEHDEGRMEIRKKVFSIASRVYDQNCPNETARQMGSWAKNRIKAYGYLSETKKEVAVG